VVVQELRQSVNLFRPSADEIDVLLWQIGSTRDSNNVRATFRQDDSEDINGRTASADEVTQQVYAHRDKQLDLAINGCVQ
jgi:hypothetical protein